MNITVVFLFNPRIKRDADISRLDDSQIHLNKEQIIDRQQDNIFICANHLVDPFGQMVVGFIQVSVTYFLFADKEWFIKLASILEEIINCIHYFLFYPR